MERTHFSLAAGAALILALTAAGATLAVRADAQSAGYAAPPASAPAPMVVSIGANGNALIRGTVVSHATNSITLETWGGTWTILGTMPVVTNGDFVGVNGVVSAAAPLTINANYVRDWSTPLTYGTNQPARTDNDLLFSGIVSDVNPSNDSLRITEYGTGVSYQVFLKGTATIWNTGRGTIGLSDIQDGDMLRVDGVATGNVIIADVARDISR